MRSLLIVAAGASILTGLVLGASGGAKSTPSIPASISTDAVESNPLAAKKTALLSQPEKPNRPSTNTDLGSVHLGGIDAKNDCENWQRYFEAAIKDLEMHRYEIAEERLNASLKSARLGMGDDQKLMLSRIGLAQLYLATQKYSQAEKLFLGSLSLAKKLKGSDSAEVASCKEGLAQIELLNNKLQKAESLIDEALAIRRRAKIASSEQAKCMILKAEILSKTNWIEQSEVTALDGISIFQAAVDSSPLDLAEALRQSALLFHEHGKMAEAQELFERSYKLIDQAARLNMPPQMAGQITFNWEEGSPRSHEIPDPDFPLKYLQVDDVRVAATIIDLWELSGVLISITNTGNERVYAALGKPILLGATADSSLKHFAKLELIDPISIDRIRRERTMWDLTMNRPWLANMQKTRSQRGFVPSTGHDLFRGPNMFGVYGEWNALPRELPDKLMIEPSPERVQYQAETKIDPGLVRSSVVKMRNLVPISLEPFESRTGELFFLNPRCEQLVLTVPVGNVIYRIPFSAKRQRIK